MSNLINVLTRTSNRPEAFKRCFESYQSQNHTAKRMVVGVDNDETRKYVEEIVGDDRTVDIVVYPHTPKDPERGDAHAPYNEYINTLLDHVGFGYILVLDDDDVFTSETSLATIASHAEEDKLILWRTEMPYGVVPHPQMENAPVLIPQQVTSCGYTWHSKHKWAIHWNPVKEADYRCAQTLSRLLPMKRLAATLVAVPSVGMGDRKDG